MATERKITGKKYHVMKDSTKKIWDVISFWTHAKDVEFTNAKKLQDTCGEIYGISSFYDENTLMTDKAHVAASYELLNNKLPFDLGIEDDVYGYYKKGTDGGADTFCPFNSGKSLYKIASGVTGKGTVDLSFVLSKYGISPTAITNSNFLYSATILDNGSYSVKKEASCASYVRGDYIAPSQLKASNPSFEYNSQTKTLTYDTGSFTGSTSCMATVAQNYNDSGDNDGYDEPSQFGEVSLTSNFRCSMACDIYMFIGSIEKT